MKNKPDLKIKIARCRKYIQHRRSCVNSFNRSLLDQIYRISPSIVDGMIFQPSRYPKLTLFRNTLMTFHLYSIKHDSKYLWKINVSPQVLEKLAMLLLAFQSFELKDHPSDFMMRDINRTISIADQIALWMIAQIDKNRTVYSSPVDTLSIPIYII